MSFLQQWHFVRSAWFAMLSLVELNSTSLPPRKRSGQHRNLRHNDLSIIHSLNADKLTTTKQIAERVYALTQKQNDSALMMGAYHALAATLYFLGNFEAARQYAMCGVQIWRLGATQSPVEDVETAAVTCLCYQALCEWHFGEIASSRATMAEAISLAKKLNGVHG
jgi:hypothetical protein